MLSTHEKFRLQDKDGKHDFFAEVNWNPEDARTNECKVIRFTLPDGKEAFVERKHLVELVFAIGSAEEQKNMIPQTITKVKWYETVLSVKAKKDIRAGENITFPIKLSLPNDTKEVIGATGKSKSPFLA